MAFTPFKSTPASEITLQLPSIAEVVKLTLEELLELEVVYVFVPNWDKHQPARKDVKTPSWLKLSNRFFRDQRIYSVQGSSKLAFIYVLAQCSEQTSNEPGLNLKQARNELGTNKVRLCKSLMDLEAIGLICFVDNLRNVDVTLDKIRLDKKRKEKKRLLPPPPAKLSNFSSHADEVKAAVAKLPGMPDLVKLWNDICGKKYKPILIPSYTMMGDLVNRWKEHPDIEVWRTAFERLKDDTCLWFIDSSNQGWRPSLSWLVSKSDERLMKAHNGEYATGVTAEENKLKKIGWTLKPEDLED